MNDDAIRIDKWLWYGRFFKTRSRATQIVSAGRVRVNRARVTKSHGMVRIGDVLTFPQGNQIRVVRVLKHGNRRGPAVEAAELYEEILPCQETGIDPGPPQMAAKHRDRKTRTRSRQDRRKNT